MHSRTDRLAAQKAQVALVFQKMLGTEEARSYLIENNFTQANIDRILNGDASLKRAGPVETDRRVGLRRKVLQPIHALVSVDQQRRDRKG